MSMILIPGYRHSSPYQIESSALLTICMLALDQTLVTNILNNRPLLLLRHPLKPFCPAAVLFVY